MQSNMGQAIRALRREKGVTQEALAAHLGVAFQTVSKWETGACLPDILLLPDIAVYFGVAVDVLFALPHAAQMDRIQNMLEDVRAFTQEQFTGAKAALETILKETPDLARAHWLLARLHLKMAEAMRQAAIPHSQRALDMAPAEKEHHTAVVEAMGGVMGDYYFRRKYALIQYYQHLLAKHPDLARGHLFLFDQLLDDGRLDEAEAVLARHMALSPRHVTHLFYQGDLCYARGDAQGALALWQQGETDYDSPRWLGAICLAERMEKLCRYGEALAGYQRAADLMEPPRFVDPQIAMAQIYACLGQYDCAIRMRQEEMAIKRADWGFESGEALDAPQREIDRLRAL